MKSVRSLLVVAALVSGCAVTKQMRVDPQGQELFNGREADVAERIRRAREHLQKYAGTPEQDRHFIAQNDGL